MFRQHFYLVFRRTGRLRALRSVTAGDWRGLASRSPPRRWRGREPYMLIQGFARLTNRKNRSRAWRLGKSNRRRSPVLFFTRTCTFGRELIWSISAHSMRARHKTTKGKPGIESPWEADRFLAHADAESLGDEGLHCVYYEEQKEKNSPTGSSGRTAARDRRSLRSARPRTWVKTASSPLARVWFGCNVLSRVDIGRVVYNLYIDCTRRNAQLA